MNKKFLDGKTLPEKMLELEALVQNFLNGTDPAAIAAITKSITEINSQLANKASDAEFQLTKKDIATLTTNLDNLLKTVSGLSGDKNRGHFATEAELNALADPKSSEFAWVGAAGAWSQYVYEDTAWVKTGGTSTHTTGYDPAELTAIKGAATVLTARVTAAEKTITANTAAAAAAKAAADGAGADAAAAKAAADKNAVAIAGLGGASGLGGFVAEVDLNDTLPEMVDKMLAVGIPVKMWNNHDAITMSTTAFPHKNGGDGTYAIAHITGTHIHDPKDGINYVELNTCDTYMIAIIPAGAKGSDYDQSSGPKGIKLTFWGLFSFARGTNWGWKKQSKSSNNSPVEVPFELEGAIHATYYNTLNEIMQNLFVDM